MDIGTAKATPEERALAPHHMLDVAPPEESYSAARYVEDAALLRGYNIAAACPSSREARGFT